MDAPPTLPLGPDDVFIQVERLTDPLSGMDLIGTGIRYQVPVGEPPIRVEVRFDGELVMPFDPIRVERPDVPEGFSKFEFGFHFPIEPHAERVQISLVMAGGSIELFEGPLSGVVHRPTPQSQRIGRRMYVRPRFLMALMRQRSFLKRQQGRFDRLARTFPPRSAHGAYVGHTALTPRLRAAMVEDAERFVTRPVISILVPVYNVDPKWLSAAVDSVRNQTYPHWELCLADDASTNAATRRYLRSLPKDPRIKIAFRKSNGHICAASNTAADLATGPFVALLDNDDQLAPDALYHVAKELQDHPDADLIYTDEDKIDKTGRRYDPQFKPDWSPDLLLSYNYVNHFTVIRRTLFKRVGRFRTGFEGSQDLDLLLRVTEATGRVRHIPRVLYHWRALPSSTASAAGVKRYVHVAGRKAVEAALTRRGIRGSMYVPPFAERLGLPVLGLDGPDDGPTVAVLVYGPAALAAETARTIRTTTAYRSMTVYPVPETGQTSDRLNRAAQTRTEEFLLFLAAGTVPTHPRWLSRLVANAAVPGVGATGGLILSTDGSVAAAGLVLGMRDGLGADAAFRGQTPSPVSYYFYAEVTRTVAAVDGRCLLTRRDTFVRLGGLDTDRFGSALWDADYSLRVRGLGERVVHVGGAEVQVPSDRSARAFDPAEELAFRGRHGRPGDPFYNPNLSEWDSFRSRIDAPLLLRAEAAGPPVRTLVTTHNLNNREGAPRYFSEIVTGLKARGAIDPVAFSPFAWPTETAYDRAGIRTVVDERPERERFNDGKWNPNDYEQFLDFANRLIRSERPDLVVANTLLMFPFVEAAARAGVPVVWIIHESYTPDQLAALFPPFTRSRIEAAFTYAARVVIASHQTADLYGRLDVRNNACVIHNGLNPAPFDSYLGKVGKAEAAASIPGTPGKKKLISVGTVCERKGQHVFVEAAARLARERDDFECYLVGVRDFVPYAQYIRQLVRRRGLDRVVHFVTETDRVWAYYRAADVFVFPSHVEAYSLSVLEAEAFGLPILATKCCGTSEQVYWGGNALSFPFGDADSLAGHLRRVLDDDSARAEMARRSRAAFDAHLTDTEVFDRYERLLLSAARQGARGSGPWLGFVSPVDCAPRKAA